MRVDYLELIRKKFVNGKFPGIKGHVLRRQFIQNIKLHIIADFGGKELPASVVIAEKPKKKCFSQNFVCFEFLKFIIKQILVYKK